MTSVLSLTQMLVFLFLYVMFSILLSILVCAAASLFFACLVSVHVSAPYAIASSTHESYTCLIRHNFYGKVVFEDIPVFGVCRPDWHDSSLYLFVLVIFFEAVVLFQTHVALNIFYQHIVHVYWGVASVVVLVVFLFMIMLSTKRRLVGNSPSMFTPSSPSLTS